MIELIDVTKAYGNEKVLDRITISVATAECKVVFGGSGSGKSTLLRLIAGLEKCDSGVIRIDGENIAQMNETQLMELNRKLGIVFQEGALFDSLPIWDNVAFRLLDEGGWPEDEIDTIVHKLLGFVGLEHTVDMMPSQLSGGMRRRVAIARALVGNPRVMLYDEPTSGLDPITAQSILDLLVRLRDLEGVTSIVVTHDLNAAFFLSGFGASITPQGESRLSEEGDNLCFIHTNFCMLKDGKIIFEGNRPALLDSRDPYIQEFIT